MTQDAGPGLTFERARWGPEDQRGTVNYITPATVCRAASLVRSGKAISLQLPLDGGGARPARSAG